MFYTKTDLDISNCKSNTFEIEYPKGSGVIGKFPEMDKYEWMDIDTARVKIVGSQLFFLNRLEEKVRKEELL
jgi:predicted NUDIX family NTP pyrophosphohydrolase